MSKNDKGNFHIHISFSRQTSQHTLSVRSTEDPITFALVNNILTTYFNCIMKSHQFSSWLWICTLYCEENIQFQQWVSFILHWSTYYFFTFFCCFGRVPMVLRMIPSITSSAPPPIEVNLESLHTDDSRSLTIAVNDYWITVLPGPKFQYFD